MKCLRKFHSHPGIGMTTTYIHVLYLCTLHPAIFGKLKHRKDRTIILLGNFDSISKMVRVAVSKQNGTNSFNISL
ncbi:hypothetical protein D3C76_1533730 [compost metagenome]